MKILISNDDGIDSPGIAALANALSEAGEVVVVAPHRERSTSGHSLTLHKPLRIFHVDKNRYSTTGSPADCIYLGIREILKEPPGLIVSGINRGANLGTDVHYSGTVAAAREGALMNIPSYAFSIVDLRQTTSNALNEPYKFEMAAQVASRIVRMTLNTRFPKHTLLNVNIPNLEPDKISGIRVTRQGFRYYANEVTRRKDPRGKDYYWIGGAYMGFEKSELSDCQAIQEGYIAIAPLTIDCTHNEFYSVLKDSSLEELPLPC
ncbi:MAG: 5'/3'-nucleotidase SurE [Deltaproteobacteria bacterium]|nr:5'/3'-nucleotidase SurE [Deltaproteobacteria bacterium]